MTPERTRQNASIPPSTPGRLGPSEPPSPASVAPGPPPPYRASQRGYGLVAPAYDLLFGLLLAQGRRKAIAALDCRAGERVLEVGVGSGLALPLYPAGTRLTGIDVSRPMLERAARRGRHLHVGLAQMDAGRLGFADASFDKAALLFTIGGLPFPQQALREVVRVCRPGATVVMVNRFRANAPLAGLWDRAFAPVYRLLRYRVDLDGRALAEDAGLQVLQSQRANLFGYATVLVCRTPASNPAPA